MAKILLVDDDPLLVRMYQTKFELDGNKVITADDGEVALQKAEEYKPDIILLDVMMPKMDGLQVLKTLKNNSVLKNIPVVMLTNVSASYSDTESGLELGAVAYLVKSNYTPKEVVQKVKEILSGYTINLPKVKTKIKQ